MSTIRICDGCGKKLDTFDSAHFLGSKKLRDVTFCHDCFRAVEDFVVDKFEIKQEKVVGIHE